MSHEISEAQPLISMSTQASPSCRLVTAKIWRRRNGSMSSETTTALSRSCFGGPSASPTAVSPNQMPRRLLLCAHLEQLARRPFRGRVLRHVEMHHPAPAVVHNPRQFLPIILVGFTTNNECRQLVQSLDRTAEQIHCLSISLGRRLRAIQTSTSLSRVAI